MRDPQRLEELSSAVATGFWAGDVAITLSRSPDERAPEELGLLEETRRLFAGEEEVPDIPVTRQVIETALGEVAAQTGASSQELLAGAVEIVTKAAAGTAIDPDDPALASTVALLEKVSDRQLLESDSVLNTRKDMSGWTETRMMSNFS